MKIGIITFHWATNYGAVLQCYALQKTLKSMGHDVSIINYKPRLYDDTIWSFIRLRKFQNIKAYRRERQKERLMANFRSKYLNLTARYFSLKQLQRDCSFDAIISGSDQVLNEAFLIHGEGGRSTAYYLDFGDSNTTRLTYAASFGTTSFPQDVADSVKSLAAHFNAVSVREQSGVGIFCQMGRKDAVVVPDPTILLNGENYRSLFAASITADTTCLYMLRGREKHIEGLEAIDYVDNNGGGIEDWLKSIAYSKNVITNSFHGTVFSILFHKPFVVVLQTKENVGMNDRFFSFLSALGLTDRITTEKSCDFTILDNAIDWNSVDVKLVQYRNLGIEFLRTNL